MKICPVCNKPKPSNKFAYRNKNKNTRTSYCKRCQKKISRQHYRANKARCLERNKKQILKCQNAVLNYLKEHPCVDCGESDPVVLDFDHKYSKEFNICKKIRATYSLETIMTEIAKCDVRCANCHRRKTAREGNWFRHVNR